MCWEYYTTAGPGMQEKNENMQFESINSSLRRRRCRREGQEMLLLYVGEEQKSRPPRDAAGGSANVVEGAGVHGAGLLAQLGDDLGGVGGDDQFLVGGDEQGVHSGVGSGDIGLLAANLVLFRIDLDAHKA